jgi:hypothetical protein
MDPEYEDVYYVDTRNADYDHRHQRRPHSSWRPGHAPPPGTRMYHGGPQSQPQPQSMVAAGAFGSSFLSRVTTGQIIEMVAELFAALQSLPAPPVATQSADTDVGNSILYQTALAQHAKRDEQVRTLGHLVSRLIG